jgi:hypothetical protein
MSTLVAAIGNVERLETVTQEQYDRIKAQRDRLEDAVYDHWMNADVVN